MNIDIVKHRSFYDILELRKFSDNPNAINVAFPVLAYECEVRAPLENELDAYEEAALKYISIGLAVNGIAKALNINESLSRQIVSKLEMEKFIVRHKGVGLKLTEDGEKYLIGIKEERPSENSRFGFMFVSALKKDILPFFYDGDIGKIDRTDSTMLECKLTDKNEKVTFAFTTAPKRWRLSQAYKRSLYIGGLESQIEDDEISAIEAQDIYADYDSFDEVEDFETEAGLEKNLDEDETAPLGYGTFVRPLKRNPVAVYLKMQIVISPDLLGGFMVESPLDLGGIDNDFFLRQIKWMQGKGDILYNGKSLNKLINSEVLKLCGNVPVGEKSFSVYILEKLPRLAVQQDNYRQVYNSLAEIYGLIGSNMTQTAREAVVNGLNQKLVEALLNRLIMSKSRSDIALVKQRALSDMNNLQDNAVFNLATSAKINRASLPNIKKVRAAFNKIDSTRGNSLCEKLVNILAIFYYLPSARIKQFVTIEGFQKCVDIIVKLNAIYNRSHHDTDRGDMTMVDYQYYISNVFTVANRLLEAMEEKN